MRNVCERNPGVTDPENRDADDVERHPCPAARSRPDRRAAHVPARSPGATTPDGSLRFPGSPTGIYDPSGPGRMLFGFFAAMAETERENIREATLEGLDSAARKGNHGGRPPVITDDMLHTVLRRRTAGETVEAIQPDLLIPTGKRKGHSPSVASIYRALAEQAKTEAYPEAVEQAHTDYAALRPGDQPAFTRPRPARVGERISDDLRARLQAQQRP
jgi:hypothetical protein